MHSKLVLSEPHSEGEVQNAPKAPPPALWSEPLTVDTHHHRYHVEWDPTAPVTPLGQLVFFSQFLATSGLFIQWVKNCPLEFESPNAPTLTNLLGTVTLAVLSGQHRYAHVNALRADTVNPPGLGMSKVCSEDSVRRAFEEADPLACQEWQTQSLRQTWMPALRLPWIMDLDVTIKTIYGHQEGAQIGYNPHKPGRPSHAYHTLFVRGLRLVLDVEVRPGKEHSPVHGQENLWRLWDSLPPQCRPWLICGDSAYGNQGLMSQAEARAQMYLFRLRQTSGVKQLIALLERLGGWKLAPNGYQGLEGQLQLSGWTIKRRIVVLRRKKPGEEDSCPGTDPHALPWPALATCEAVQYEYQVLVTNLQDELLTVADLYRQRADCENVYDQLKNQWGWGGFVTKDILRCQISARNVAIIYNWWSLFVRCAQPTRPMEAITSRPLLLCAVGRFIRSANQVTLRLTSSHAEASRAQGLLTNLSLFLSGLKNTAEQLSPAQCWERIWDRILAPLLTPTRQLGAPSG